VSDSARPAPVVSLPQTLAGAGAAVTAAVAGSTLGVAGTFIGAAVASVVSTVAAALYGRSLQRASERIATKGLPVPKPTLARTSASRGSAAQTSELRSGADDIGDPGESSSSRFSMPRKRLALVAAALFVSTIGIVTVAEVALGRPISAAISGNEAGGTSLGQLGRGNVGAPEPAAPRSTQPSESGTAPAPAGTSPSPGTRSPAPSPGTSTSDGTSGDAEPTSPAEEPAESGTGGTGGTGGTTTTE
jgi:hypothetical protein